MQNTSQPPNNPTTQEPTQQASQQATQALQAPPGAPLVVAVLGKGGDGKTTSACALADAFATTVGWDTLVVDLDAQASLTTWLAPKLSVLAQTVDDVLMGQAEFDQAVLQLSATLRLLPASNALAVVEHTLDTDALGQRVVLPSEAQVVVLDTPASRPLGPTATILRSALDTADVVVIPFQPTSMSLDAMHETLAHVNAHEELEDRQVPVFLLPTKVHAQSNAEAVVTALHLGKRFDGILPSVPFSRWPAKAVERRQRLREMPGGAIQRCYDEGALDLAVALQNVAVTA